MDATISVNHASALRKGFIIAIGHPGGQYSRN
jgi:hypothetical protein